ncbi:ribosome biogenesis protein BRX1-like protein [Leptotrombidium deliense]|uniref:Ribosome biogenesis protein BRX1 homolog n=1 Tax=Leptotrombidium deliense TaxID=299467 RepID=A0A443SAP0_9ACAR|nr:ribosome biogenesis protein BRX1-like protein [Leptotrombidium deliense]
MGKRKRDSKTNSDKLNGDSKADEVEMPEYRFSDDVPVKKMKWTNKQRVLVFASRGVTFRDRHLLLNLRKMLPHSKTESKMDKKDPLLVINDICEMKNCNKCLYFENKKKQDLYLWISNIGRGPSAKFLVENIHTMEELRMTGNCLKASRPLLSFDPSFDSHPHYALLKELFVQTFGTPNGHPKSQPFIDHIFTFTVLDHRIWFRNYQIAEEDGSLIEVGPRFVLNLIKIFDGSFGGPVLYENTHFVSPNKHRAMIKKEAQQKYKDRVLSKQGRAKRDPKGEAYKDIDVYDDVFDTIEPEKAKGAEKDVFRRKRQ